MRRFSLHDMAQFAQARHINLGDLYDMGESTIE
jgi:hypothetical protein